MMQSHNSKLIYQHRLWQELEHRLNNLQAVCLSIQATVSEVSLALTWQSEDMSLSVLESESMPAEYEGLVQKSEAAKCNIQELSHSLKSLKVQLDAVHKTVSEVEAQLYTSLYGTKKSKISLSSRIIKALKTTVLGN